MQTADEILKPFVKTATTGFGKYQIVDEHKAIKAMIEFARQACEEQKVICLKEFQNSDDYYPAEVIAIKNAPLPDLK